MGETHLGDVSDQRPVQLVDSVAVQLGGVGDQLDQVGHRFVPHVTPCLAEQEDSSQTRMLRHAALGPLLTARIGCEAPSSTAHWMSTFTDVDSTQICPCNAPCSFCIPED